MRQKHVRPTACHRNAAAPRAAGLLATSAVTLLHAACAIPVAPPGGQQVIPEPGGTGIYTATSSPHPQTSPEPSASGPTDWAGSTFQTDNTTDPPSVYEVNLRLFASGTFALSGDDTFSVPGLERGSGGSVATGSYTLAGGDLTLTFADGSTLSAHLIAGLYGHFGVQLGQLTLLWHDPACGWC